MTFFQVTALILSGIYFSIAKMCAVRSTFTANREFTVSYLIIYHTVDLYEPRGQASGPCEPGTLTPGSGEPGTLTPGSGEPGTLTPGPCEPASLL